MKILWSALLHRATITNHGLHLLVIVVRFSSADFTHTFDYGLGVVE